MALSADAIVSRLQAHWLQLGYAIKTEIVMVAAAADKPPMECVRSDLVGGLPRGWEGDRRRATEKRRQ